LLIFFGSHGCPGNVKGGLKAKWGTEEFGTDDCDSALEGSFEKLANKRHGIISTENS
jgi:hypothetical protein